MALKSFGSTAAIGGEGMGTMFPLADTNVVKKHQMRRQLQSAASQAWQIIMQALNDTQGGTGLTLPEKAQFEKLRTAAHDMKMALSRAFPDK